MRSFSLVALLLVGCGGGGVVGGMPDLGGSGGGGGGGGGSTTPPSLIAGDFTDFAGVTASGWAILTDSSKSAWAIKLADGTRQKIADHASWAVILAADTALVEHDVASDGFGALASWHGDGPAVTLTTASPDNSFGFSSPAADSAGHVAYFSRTTPAGALNDLVVDRFDHSAPHTVASGIELSPSSGDCWPNLRYFDGRLLGTHCATAGSSTRTLTSWDADSGAGVDLLASSQQGFTTRAGIGVLMTSTTGALTLAAADGTSPRAIASDIQQARLTDDGSALVAVVASSKEIERIALASGAPTPLVGPVGRIVGLSPDAKFLTYSTMSDPTTFATDLWLGSATTLQSAKGIVGTNTTWTLGSTFTDDSAYALYADAYDANAFTGALQALPTNGVTTTPRMLGTGVYMEFAAGGSRVVFVDNTTGSYPSQRADVEFVDLAQPTPPTKLAKQALASFELAADNHTLYYVQPSEGLHIVALP